MCNDLKKLDLDVENIKGQGYDGALNVSSDCTRFKHISGKSSHQQFILTLMITVST